MISAEAFLRRNPVASQDMPIAEQHVQSKPSGRFSRRGRDAAVVEDPNDLDACREAALRLLDAAPRASGALRERLLAKGYGEAIVDEVIERLIRVQLIDDSAYAESAVRYCAGRMMGRRGTVMELARKGVDRKLAEQVCDEAEQNGIFEDAAWELGRQNSPQKPMASIVGSVSVGFGPPAAAKATAPKPSVESPPNCWCSQEKNETSYTRVLSCRARTHGTDGHPSRPDVTARL